MTNLELGLTARQAITHPPIEVVSFTNRAKAELMGRMRRREFITLLGGVAVAWPLAVQAQQPFRIGLLNTGASTFFIAPFMGKLEEFGYLEGKNVVIERKFAEGNRERLKEFAADLVSSSPRNSSW